MLFAAYVADGGLATTRRSSHAARARRRRDRDAHRGGTLDVHDVDEVIHHYERAARELWKFCWSGGVGAHIEIVARIIEEPVREDDAVDWWQRGAPPERGIAACGSRGSALER